MKIRTFQTVVTMVVCMALMCCTNAAWAGWDGVAAKCAGMGYSVSSGGGGGFSGGGGGGYSGGGGGGGGYSGGGGSTLGKLAGIGNRISGVSTGISTGVSSGTSTGVSSGISRAAGTIGHFASSFNVSSTGITPKNAAGTFIHTATDVSATSVANTVESSSIGVQQSTVSNVPGVVQKFATMSADQKMQVMEYGNGSIWHYQETAGQVDANGQNVWQPSLNVLGDIWEGMSQEGQYMDQDGNIITNSPFGTNGVGQPENNMITPGEGFTWNDVKAAAYEWCAKNNVNTSCGLQEAQFNKMQYDLEAAGIIDMVNPQEMQSYLTNTGNTRANAEAFVNGQEITPSALPGSWVAVNTDSFLGKMGTAGNSPFDTSESVNNDGVFVPSTIYINANASDAYVQQTFNEAWDLYGQGSCYTGRQLKMAVLNYMKSKGAIGWNEYFN